MVKSWLHVIAKARANCGALPVIHRFGGVILERAVIAPVVLLALQEWATFEHEDLLSTRSQSVKQCPAPSSRADDDKVEMVCHTGVGRALQKNLTKRGAITPE